MSIFLEEIGIQLQFPIKIKCDNVGATYLANNHCNSQRTKHVDTLFPFAQQWVEVNIIKIMFTPTLKHSADFFTKNTSEEIFQIHSITEICHFKSAAYEDLIHLNEQNDWIVVAKHKSKKNQTKTLETAKQEGKLNPSTNKPKPVMEDAKPKWTTEPVKHNGYCGKL
jgi:hypothetical protein